MVIIKLEVDEAGVRLEVTDDGVGMDPSQGLGVGLSGMRERMKRLGGDARAFERARRDHAAGDGPEHAPA